MKLKNLMLGGVLATIAVLGPMVAYAGVSVIYPSSEHTATVNTSPPITFAEGTDYASANTLGFASDFATADSDSDFSVTIYGLAGGTVTIDKYAEIAKDSLVTTSFKLQIGTAISAASLDSSEISSLKVRLWTGGTAPTADNSAGVCAYLDLESAASTESSGSCTADAIFMQVVMSLTTGAAGSSTVSIRPSSIVFA